MEKETFFQKKCRRIKNYFKRFTIGDILAYIYIAVIFTGLVLLVRYLVAGLQNGSIPL